MGVYKYRSEARNIRRVSRKMIIRVSYHYIHLIKWFHRSKTKNTCCVIKLVECCICS